MSFAGLSDISPGMGRRFRLVCAYCKGDPVKSVCVNCGAPQSTEAGQILFSTSRVLSTAQIAAYRKQFVDMYR